LHTVASAHAVPLATAACWQPRVGLHESVVHTLPSSQLGAMPGVHTPAWQVSAPLHALPSEHDVPLATAGFWHAPPLHTSAVHTFPSAQSPLTTQVRHPAIGVCVQPSAMSQASMVQAFPSLQLGGAPATQVPPWHVSVPLQTSASAHEVPLGSVVCRQPVTVSQVSTVHGLASSQSSGVPAVHAPP